jgi:hypothetical protein
MSVARTAKRVFKESAVRRDILGRFAVQAGSDGDATPSEHSTPPERVLKYGRLKRPVAGDDLGMSFQQRERIFRRFSGAAQDDDFHAISEAERVDAKIGVNKALNARIRQMPGWQAVMTAAAAKHPATRGTVDKRPDNMLLQLTRESTDDEKTMELYDVAMKEDWERRVEPTLKKIDTILKGKVLPHDADIVTQHAFRVLGDKLGNALMVGYTPSFIRGGEIFNKYRDSLDADLPEMFGYSDTLWRSGVLTNADRALIHQIYGEENLPPRYHHWADNHRIVENVPEADQEDAIRAEYSLRQFTDAMIRQWAQTSGDDSIESHLTLLAAKDWADRRFDDSRLDHGSHYEGMGSREVAEANLTPELQAGYDLFFDAMYEETQDYLKSQGIEDLTVYRGAAFGDFPWETDFKPGNGSEMRNVGRTETEYAIEAIVNLDDSTDLAELMEQFVTLDEMRAHRGDENFSWSAEYLFGRNLSLDDLILDVATISNPENIRARRDLIWSDLHDLYDELVPVAVDGNRYEDTLDSWLNYYRDAMMQSSEPNFAILAERWNLLQEEGARSGLTEYEVDASDVGGLALNPISSWSSDKTVARMFADGETGGGHREGDNGVVMRATVPRGMVLSTSVTGFGALPEYEFVLLGQPLDTFGVEHLT